MLTIEHVLQPTWNDTQTAIILQVKFVEFDEMIPFGATPHDPMPYGVDLYNRALAGEFGEIGPYVPPPPLEKQPTVQGAQTL